MEHDGCPTRAADGKTENASTNVVARPGASSGTVTCQNRCRGPAPSVAAARSRLGSIPDRLQQPHRVGRGQLSTRLIYGLNDVGDHGQRGWRCGHGRPSAIRCPQTSPDHHRPRARPQNPSSQPHVMTWQTPCKGGYPLRSAAQSDQDRERLRLYQPEWVNLSSSSGVACSSSRAVLTVMRRRSLAGCRPKPRRDGNSCLDFLAAGAARFTTSREPAVCTAPRAVGSRPR